MSFAFCKASFAVALMLLVLMELFVLGESAVVEADMATSFCGKSSGSVTVDWTIVSDMREAGRSVVDGNESFKEMDD